MNVYNKVIEETLRLLSHESVRNLEVDKKYDWKMLNENEFFLKSDSAFELGIRTKPSTCFTAVTSDNDLIHEDKILLFGPDIQEIEESVPFTRITFLNIDNEENPDKAYQGIKKLEFARFKIIPEGYMVLSSSLENKEQVRISKNAVAQGLNFTIVGNIIINKYKADYNVNHAQVIFITEELQQINEIINLASKVDEITNAFDHILKNVIFDCDSCPLQSICDDVEALRILHFAVKNK